MKKITILTIIIMIIGLIFMSNVSKAAVEDIQEKKRRESYCKDYCN